MVSRKATDFDGIESLHEHDVDAAPASRTRTLGLVTMSFLILGALTALVALFIGAVVGVPLVLGLILLHN